MKSIYHPKNKKCKIFKKSRKIKLTTLQNIINTKIKPYILDKTKSKEVNLQLIKNWFMKTY